MFEGEQDFERRRKKRIMATVAMVIISDGRHGYKMATDAQHATIQPTITPLRLVASVSMNNNNNNKK